MRCRTMPRMTDEPQPTRLNVVRRGAGAARAAIRRNPAANRAYRTTVGVTGVGLTALGVALIPLPGPGTLVALGGLALLGTEFEGAKKVSTKANDAAATALRAARARQARRRAERQAAARPS